MGCYTDQTDLLFSKRDLRSWLEQQRQRALDEVRNVPPGKVLAHPHEQIAEEIIACHELGEPTLQIDEMAGEVGDQQVDVSGDFSRVILDDSRPFYIDGTRIALHVPYDGPVEALRLQASTFSYNPPRAVVHSNTVTVFRDVSADTLERNRDKVIQGLRNEVTSIDKYLGYARADIKASNDQLRREVAEVAAARRKKVLADRDTEAMLGVPLKRDDTAAHTYRVQPAQRKRLSPTRRPGPREPFAPEPAITDDDFADIIGDIVTITQTFERLAVTYADMDEERLRDQILTMLGNVYGPATGESFSKRGKSDIYLPWEGRNPVFLAECKWWNGPKRFAQYDLPQLLDRYVVWRDTHAAMILFIRNKDASAVIDKAIDIVRNHGRYVRDGNATRGAPVFVLHKDGDPDREIQLALVTAAVHT